MGAFFQRLPISPAFTRAIAQIHKNEFEAAARTALIVVEEQLKQATHLDAYGSDLFAKAFNYKLDSEGKLSDPPLIRVNDLLTESDRAEHEGIKLLCLGTSKGIRNLVAHNTTKLLPQTCVSILVLCNLVLDIITSGSILNDRYCIWTRIGTNTHKKSAG